MVQCTLWGDLASQLYNYYNGNKDLGSNSEHSQLLEATNLIIWDEAPMSHKNCFEALDKTLKDVMRCQGLENTIFGGKVVFLEAILDIFFLLF